MSRRIDQEPSRNLSRALTQDAGVGHTNPITIEDKVLADINVLR